MVGRKRGFRKPSISCWQAAVTADLSAADRPLARMCPLGSRRFDMIRHWLSPVPGQKLTQPLDSMIVDASQHIGKPSLWIVSVAPRPFRLFVHRLGRIA